MGGKTAINISAGKNLVGAFYNPKGVIIDTMVLDSLPKREFKAGLAEVLKYAFIQNRYLFSLLKRDFKKIMSMDKKLIEEIIFESIKTPSRSKIIILYFLVCINITFLFCQKALFVMPLLNLLLHQ